MSSHHNIMLGLLMSGGAPPPPPPATGLFIPITLSMSRKWARLTFMSPNYLHNSYIIQRSSDGGNNWQTLEVAFQFVNPMNIHSDVPTTSFPDMFPYLYYIDDTVQGGATYKYKVIGGGGEGETDGVQVIGTTYYFSSSLGNDGNNGLSEGAPKRSLNAIRNLTKNPGDTILLKRGDTFNHEVSSDTYLVNNSSGTEENPIFIGAYGTGNKPKIIISGFGIGGNQDGIKILDSSYIHLDNLWIVSGSSPTQYRTVTIKAFNPGTYRGIKILNCDVDSSKPTHGSQLNGGIFTWEEGRTQNVPDKQVAFLSDLEIAYCYVHGERISSAIRIWSCKEYCHVHNNFTEDSLGGVTFSGGYRHLREWNIHFALETGTSTFGKTNSQGYYASEIIHRYEFGVNSTEGGYSFQEASDCIQYNCTGDAIDGSNYSGTYHTYSPGSPGIMSRCVIVKNIFTGDFDGGGEGCYVDYPGTPANETLHGTLVNDNIYYNYVTDGVLINNKPASIVITPTNFNSNWVPDHPGDKNINPQYANRGGSDPVDWIPQNTTAQNYGRFVPVSSTQITILGSIVGNTRWNPITRVLINAKNEIAVRFSHDLNENFNSTTVIAVQGKTVTATRVYRNTLYITVDDNFVQGQDIFFSYTKPAEGNQNLFNTLQDIFGGLQVASFANKKVDENGIY